MSLSLAVLNAAVLLAAPLVAHHSLISNTVNILLVAAGAGALFTLTRDTGKILTVPLRSFCQNAAWAIWMTTLTTIPATVILGPMNRSNDNWLRVFRERRFRGSAEAILFMSIVGLLVGNWVGCIVIPLDWGRAWQKWPIPNAVLGSILYLVGALLGCWMYGCKGATIVDVEARRKTVTPRREPAKTASTKAIVESSKSSPRTPRAPRSPRSPRSPRLGATKKSPASRTRTPKAASRSRSRTPKPTKKGASRSPSPSKSSPRRSTRR